MSAAALEPVPPPTSPARAAPPETNAPGDAGGWLLSRRADFWAACGGASLAIALAALFLAVRGDRELDALDFVFSELHLGATYDAVVRRKLWRRMPYDTLLAPALIVLAAYAFDLLDGEIYLHTGLLYLAVWHRGRQDYGVARYYQRRAGGPASPLHDRLFHAAIYLPMVASVLFYTSAYPTHYEDEPYFALPFATHTLRHVLNLVVAVAAAGAVGAYLWHTAPGRARAARVHPGERWVVMAHAAAFASAYFLGAWRASFILVLALHHEVQYLFFAYAVARKDPARAPRGARRELRFAAGFALLPLVGLSVERASIASELDLLVPLSTGLLLAHYWMDARIWKGPAMRPAA